MRLLNVHSLQLHEFFEQDVPRYCILSHRWGNEEVSFKEFKKGTRKDAAGYRKIVAFCDFVRRRRFSHPFLDEIYFIEWVWIDTCCIDKRSSAELSEAINSMYSWYSGAVECIVYLYDLPGPLDAEHDARRLALRASSWFRRGWTLQELLAPTTVIFCDKTWQVYGHISDECCINENRTGFVEEKECCHRNISEDLAESILNEVSQITGINKWYFNWSARVEASSAQIMSWAANRETTRKEDEAYCLLGLFRINMPLIYGEGWKAFRRLQEEIIKRSTDQSIFAWDLDLSGFETSWGILAVSPKAFWYCGNIEKDGICVQKYSIANNGLEIRTKLYVPRKDLPSRKAVYLIWLRCERVREGSSDSRGIPIFLTKEDSGQFYRTKPAQPLDIERTKLKDLGERTIYIAC